MPLTIKQLERTYDRATAEAIMELIAKGEIDRPRVSEGEKYLYIDTRILRAPYGIISQHEVKAACQANLSGTAWGVYCYLLTCMSGRLSPNGTEIGGKQIMLATGYSKPSVYRACIALEKAGLIKPSNASLNRRAWLLCNPKSDDLQDAASELALMNASKESDVIQEVYDHNSQVRSVSNLVNKPENGFRSEKQIPEKSVKSLKSDTNINTEIMNSKLLIGGEIDQQLIYSKGIELKLISPYLQKELDEQVSSLRAASAEDDRKVYEALHDRYMQAETPQERKQIEHQITELQDRHEQGVIEMWGRNPFLIADDLLNRRSQKTCRLRYWGWAGTQSLKKVATYIHEFACSKRREYVYNQSYDQNQGSTQETRLKEQER